MKKSIKIIVLIMILTITNVTAKEYDTKLIPIDDSATISTNNFKYEDIRYAIDNNKGIFSINSITNISKEVKPIYISVDILLFDGNKKNIGMVTYCSKSDVDSDYTGYTLKTNESIPYSIKVANKYYVKDKTASDVKYYSIIDDNIDCRVGGYSKYSGLTLDEINSGKRATDYETSDSKIINFINSVDLSKSTALLIILVIFLIVILFVQGLFLNTLHDKMYGNTTLLAYLPFTCTYISLKMAFGKFIAILWFPLAGLSVLNQNTGAAMLMNIVNGLAFILDIIKLITKKYAFLNLDFLGKNKFKIKKDEASNASSSVVKEVQTPPSNIEENSINEEEKTIDLDYDSVDNSTPATSSVPKEEAQTSQEKNDSDLTNLYK